MKDQTQKPERIRQQYESEVSSPGSYEGQERYVPYMHEQTLNGGGECLAARQDSVDCIMKVGVTEEDKELFPELRDVESVYLHEDNYGFITEITEMHAKELVDTTNEAQAAIA